jgi:prolyl-tRNA synthetase
LAKETVNDDAVVAEVGRLLEDIQRNLFARAKTSLDASISESKEYEQFKKVIGEQGGFVRASWCGERDCEQTIKADTGATIRTLPLSNDKPSSDCVRCGKPGAKVAYFARSY